MTAGGSRPRTPAEIGLLPVGRRRNEYDVVLTRALAQRPVRIGEIDACSDEPWEDFRRAAVRAAGRSTGG
jgi:hypothetical protein